MPLMGCFQLLFHPIPAEHLAEKGSFVFPHGQRKSGDGIGDANTGAPILNHVVVHESSAGGFVGVQQVRPVHAGDCSGVVV